MPNINPKVTWPVFLVVLAFGGIMFLGTLGLAATNGLFGKEIADSIAKAQADSIAKAQADSIAKTNAEANQSTATSLLSNTAVTNDEPDTVKVNFDVDESYSSGWAGQELAKLIWKTARKNPKAKTIEAAVELDATLKDQYGKVVRNHTSWSHHGERLG